MERKQPPTFGRLGIRVILVTLVTLTLGFLISSWQTLQSEQRLLSDQLDARGRSLARISASACISTCC